MNALRAACGLAAALLLALPGVSAAAVGPTGLHVVNRLAGPDGGWDLASFDPARRRVYIAHGATVIAIDADSGKAVFDFAAGSRLHAVVPVPGTDLVVTTNSGDSSAKVISAVDGKLIASIPTPADPDSAIFDPASGEVLVVGGDSGTITFVNAQAQRATRTISIGGKLEFPALDGKGRLFVNDEDANDIAVVDIAGGQVLARYAMPGCKSPTGLAYVAGNRLVAACGNGGVRIVEATTGAVMAAYTIGAFPDAVIYDPQRALAMVPSGVGGTLTVIALSGAANNMVVDTVPTQVGARTGTVDPKSGRVYLPSAEYNPPAGPGQRPTPKPGTFNVLVLDR
jgi:DNA-binding beta-propeller fold protein YncE